jgi:hypothetical protein
MVGSHLPTSDEKGTVWRVDFARASVRPIRRDPAWQPRSEAAMGTIDERLAEQTYRF